MLIVRRTVQRDPERVQQEMEEVFRSLVPGRPHVTPRHNQRWRPPVEVYETDDALLVVAEIAGMDERRVSVVVENDVLTIRGERSDHREGERRSYREAGIAYGPFGVDIFIPFPVETDDAEADYANGFLRIRLPKSTVRTIVPKRPDDPAGGDEGAGQS